MKIAIIADPISGFKIAKDSTFAMMREAAKRGHRLFVCEMHDLFVDTGQVLAAGHWVSLHPDKTPWFTLEEADTIVLGLFDAVLMRKDPPFNMEFFYATQLLELAQEQGAVVVNNPIALRNYNEKLAILRHADWIAPTVVSSQMPVLRRFIEEQSDVILKPLDGMGGAGIFRVSPQDPNLSVILETITAHNQQTIMAQQYIPAISRGDKRILLINGSPVPYSLARIPAQGETRGNLAAGGTGVAMPLTVREREIAESIGTHLATQGLFLVGLDVIGDYLTEINVTSPTCFQEITQQSGVDVAALFIDALELLCGNY